MSTIPEQLPMLANPLEMVLPAQARALTKRWERTSPRNREMAVRYFLGASCYQLAREYGLTHERVRQIMRGLRVTHLRPVRIEWRRCRPCGLSYQVGQSAEHRASAEHFWRQVDRSGPGCWEWQGYRLPSRYGSFRGMSTHRRSWILTNGPIPGGLFVCHHCDNPPCVRPDHLFLGTAADNAQDRDAKGRGTRGRIIAKSRRTHCFRGHPLEGDNILIFGKGGRRCRTCYRKYRAA